MLSDELRLYPKTGRFLAGRARQGMSDAEKAAFEAMVGETRSVEDGERIVARGQVCEQSTILIEGFMVRTLEANGRRYAVSFHVPGDFVDLHCYALKRLDHNIDCIGPVRIGLVPHEHITRTMREDPHLGRLLWFSTLLDAALHREWIMKLEQLTAPRRIAHIFAEIWRRLEMVGLGREDGFDTPMTQSDLADMCGATPIHANRAVGDLRKQGLADFRRGRVTIPHRKRLESYADFDHSYLYGQDTLGQSANAPFDA